MFWFKKKEVVVNCFVDEYHSYVKNYAPVQPAHKFYPEWWKKLKPTEYDQKKVFMTGLRTNMKFCNGFIENFKHGFMVPLWCDLSIIIDETNSFNYHFSDGKTSIEGHNNEQAQGFMEDYIFLKIKSPWLFECEQKDTKFVYNPCMWNYPKPPPWVTPSGIVDFTHNKSTHIFILPEKKKQEIFIHFGQPMIHYIPLTDKRVVLNTEVLTSSEYNKKFSYNALLTFQGRSVINRKRVSEGKCPIKTVIKKSTHE